MFFSDRPTARFLLDLLRLHVAIMLLSYSGPLEQFLLLYIQCKVSRIHRKHTLNRDRCQLIIIRIDPTRIDLMSLLLDTHMNA
jgi:hypothetical protein